MHDLKTFSYIYEEKYLQAARRIWKCWTHYRDKMYFKRLKHYLLQSERTLTLHLLQRLHPNEAQLLKDPVTQARIRFRLGGTHFPPSIFYKIYTRGLHVHYFSNQITYQAPDQACKIMGKWTYFEKVVIPEMKLPQCLDVSHAKEYQHYLSDLDTRPIDLGGRNNGWRLLIQWHPSSVPFVSSSSFMHRNQRPGQWNYATGSHGRFLPFKISWASNPWNPFKRSSIKKKKKKILHGWMSTQTTKETNHLISDNNSSSSSHESQLEVKRSNSKRYDTGPKKGSWTSQTEQRKKKWKMKFEQLKRLYQWHDRNESNLHSTMIKREEGNKDTCIHEKAKKYQEEDEFENDEECGVLFAWADALDVNAF